MGWPSRTGAAASLLSSSVRLEALSPSSAHAVQHAHRPSLSTAISSRRTFSCRRRAPSKLLDFGIAKLSMPQAWGIEASQTLTEMRADTGLRCAGAAPRRRPSRPPPTCMRWGVVLYELVADGSSRGRRDAHDGGVARARRRRCTPPSDAVRRAGQAGRRESGASASEARTQRVRSRLPAAARVSGGRRSHRPDGPP